MNTLKNIAKKAVAVGSGAIMLGVTAGSALALDLAEYPAPFIANGQFDGLIVVGEKAASADILGAIEIAAALQASSTTPVGSGSSGSSTTTTLSGDVKQIASSGDMLEIGEQLGSVVESLTEDDLEFLQDGTVTTQSGTTDFEQTLDLTSAAGSALVLLDENNDDETGTYLFWNDGATLFNYTLEFTSGLESDIDADDVAEDIEDEALFMLGNYYTIVNANTDQASDEVTLEFIAGDVTDTLAEGETATYTVDGKDYEITVLVIGDSDGDTTVKFVVNGEVTDAMVDGDTDTLSDGLEIGVRDIIETSAYRESDPSSIVEFYLGANKVELTDGDITSTATTASVEINNENIEDATANIIGSFPSATDLRINSIEYALAVDAAYKTDIYLSEGEGVRAALDEEQGMLGNWDIVYQGLSDPDYTDVSFNSEGDDQYNLVFTNLRGQEFDVPYAYAGTTAASDGTYGDEDDGFFFTERDANADADPDVDADYNVGLDDYFALTDVGGTGTADNGDDSYILQFTDVDEDESTVTFENIGDGSEVKATYAPTGALGDTPGAPATGDITIGGKDFSFWVIEDLTIGAGAYRIAVDMDNSGSLENNSVLDVVVRGGGILTLSNNSVQSAGNPDGWVGATFNATLTTDADDIDSDVNQATFISITETTDELDVDFDSSNTGGTGTFYYDDDSDADTETALNNFGTWFKKTDDTDESDDLIISYPDEQVEAMVYVTGGEVKKTTSTSTGGPSRVNRIAVGSAVLDTDVTYDQDNMIVVGGPCVNVIAAQMLKNPADCTEGFEQGHAWLKLVDTGAHTALLVAGYGAQDTQGASRVLAEYADYDLSGMEADVVVESLTNIMVK